MYKKKLAVRTLTAIAAGALLASNMTAAFAGTTAAAAQVVDKNEVKQDTSDEASEEISEETKDALLEESEEQTEEGKKENTEESKKKPSEVSKDVTEEAKIETETEEKTETETETKTETKPQETAGAKTSDSSFLTAEEKANDKVFVKTYFKDADGKTVLSPVTIGITDVSDADEFSSAVALWLEGKRPGEFTYEVEEAPAQDEDGRYSAVVVLTKKSEAPKPVEIRINYIDAETGHVIDTYIYHTTSDVTELDPEILAAGLKDHANYELLDKETSVSLGGSELNIKVVEKEETSSTQTVWLNYVDSNGKNILSMCIEVPYGDTEVNVDTNEDVQNHIPAGYQLRSAGDVSIEDEGYGLQLNVKVDETEYQTSTAQVTLLLDGTPVGTVEIRDVSVNDKDAFKAQINAEIADRNLEVKGELPDGGWYDGLYKLTVNVMEKTEEKPSGRTPVKTYFVDTEGNLVLEPVTIGVNDINDAEEFNNAVKLWVESKRPGEFTYEVKVEPVQGEDGLYNATVILTKKAAPSEKADVTVYFKTEDFADVAELGSNGIQTFESVDLAYAEAFRQQIESYVSAHGYEVVRMETPTAENAHVVVVVKNAAEQEKKLIYKVVAGDFTKEYREGDPEVTYDETFKYYKVDLSGFIKELSENGYETDMTAALQCYESEIGQTVTFKIWQKETLKDVNVSFKAEVNGMLVDVEGLAEKNFQADLTDLRAFEQAVKDYVRTETNGKYEVYFIGEPAEVDGVYGCTVLVREAAETPAPSEKVTIMITFVDADGNVIGTGTATVDKDAVTVTPDQISGLPADYAFVGDVFDITGGTATVLVRKTEMPAPEQQDAKLIVKLMYGNTQIGEDQVFTANGPVGQSHVFTKDNARVEIPSNFKTYYFMDTLSDTTVAYGETKTVTLALGKRNTGNGGGSGSGGGTAVSTGASGTLTGGTWKLDDKGWWYQYTNSTYAKNGWYTLQWNDRLDWYYFDANGYLVSGWYTDANGVKYYLHPLHDGRFGYMYTGWNKVDGAWQFFNDDTQNGVYGALVQGMPVPAELANQ